MKHSICFLLLLGVLMNACEVTAAAPSEAELIKLRGTFETRRDSMFQLLREKPLKVAKKRQPLAPGRAAYTRHYSYSITSFAMKAFWLNEQLDVANAALADNCRYYIGEQKARDDRDSFYWAADVVCRLLELFGHHGARAAGRLSPRTEDLMLEMMWLYCKNNSRLADADYERNRAWHIHESENHHIQGFSTVWHFSKFLKDAPLYQARKYDDGRTPAQHYEAWTAYSKEYMRERVRKGLFVETANKGYGVMTLKGIYNFQDFADDPELRRLARVVLDLYWATWAEEQIDGVRGGGASRVYQGAMSQFGRGGINRWAGFYLGRGHGKPPSNNEFTVLTSSYRMPLVVMDIALDAAGRGVYEVQQRRLGLAEKGYYKPPDYRLRTDYGGIMRYTYCTPDFVMGTAMLEARPLEDWSMISSQNRWLGVIFRGHQDARIYPQCDARGGRTYNQQWSVQRKGTMIAQKLRDSRGCKDMRIWFARRGLTNRVERGGWVFVEAKGAYAAVRPADGGYKWDPAGRKATGDWLRCTNSWSPVIIEVARKAEMTNYGSFQTAVLACSLQFEGKCLTYTGLADDTFTFFADHSRPPLINGEPIDYAPPMVFDSPFIQSRWNSGIVTIQKGKRQIVLDVNAPPRQADDVKGRRRMRRH